MHSMRLRVYERYAWVRIFIVIPGLTVVQHCKHGYKEPITIISKEPYAPIDRCGAFLVVDTSVLNISNRTKLSKALITDPIAIMWKSPADLKIMHGTTLRLGAVRSLTIAFHTCLSVLLIVFIGSHICGFEEQDCYY